MTMPDAGLQISVLTEEETPRGWLFAVLVERAGSRVSHTLRLDWSDHDYWTGGRVAPSSLAEEVVRILVEELAPGALPAVFDASSGRRWAPALDGRLAGRFGRAESRT